MNQKIYEGGKIQSLGLGIHTNGTKLPAGKDTNLYLCPLLLIRHFHQELWKV
jgi:hypothetical protein